MEDEERPARGRSIAGDSPVAVDVHAHTTYSDGSPLPAMVAAAEASGLDGLGLTDHCIAVDDAFGRRERYDLVETYERRREAIGRVQARTDVTLYDAAEVSYPAGVGAHAAGAVPATTNDGGTATTDDRDTVSGDRQTDWSVIDEADAVAATRSFLDGAGFDYTIGSVHFAGEFGYTGASQHTGADDDRRRAAVERYYDAVVALVESGLFDVLGHLDLPERVEALRGHSTREDYERVAAALADSRTVPEVNAGRVHRGLERVHPDPAMLDCFRERGVRFVLGTDSHAPAELERRVPALHETLDEYDVETVGIETVLA